MAKPFKNAGTICIVLSIIALIGILAGINYQMPLLTMFGLLPTVIYEVYRTEGESTKWASRGLLAVYVLEIIFIFKNISFNVADFLEKSEEYVKGYQVPLGDIKVVAPALMAILAIVLFTKTRGRYTKWLSVIIIITSFAIVYSLDPEIFKTFLKLGVNEAIDQLN
ncbi:hypothetical protein JW752_02355 [Candidatus Peregrinibacteria bacterium]|nr:hypothetical protein [Candidatus Peregrinibacteria bacterium]